MPVALVIVESPAKANTIARYLGSDYVVESSIGHVRDLPQNAADVPKAYKDQPWARLGIDVDHGFKPLYVVSPDKRKQIAKLKKLLAGAEVLYLATDEDREGEAIAWHLQQVLKPPKRVDVKRMVFHEITARRSAPPSRHRATSTAGWSIRRRRGASSTGCSVTKSRRCCGRRSSRGCPRAACRA